MNLQKPVSRAAEKRIAKQARAANMRDVYRQVEQRDRYCCRACGKKLTRGGGLLTGIHHHHIVLKSAGGQDTTWNLACVCSDCHSERHAYRLLIQGDADRKLRFERNGVVWFS